MASFLVALAPAEVPEVDADAWAPAVIATAGPGEALAAQLREASRRMELDDEVEAPAPARESPRERYAWAMLLARIYGSDQAMLVRKE